jgi:hypothetical protein
MKPNLAEIKVFSISVKKGSRLNVKSNPAFLTKESGFDVSQVYIECTPTISHTNFDLRFCSEQCKKQYDILRMNDCYYILPTTSQTSYFFILEKIVY